MLKSKNILKQEHEFIKLNEEIESKTKILLSEVDHIKEAQSDNEKLYWRNLENGFYDKNKKSLQIAENGEEKEKSNSDCSTGGLVNYWRDIKNEVFESGDKKRVHASKESQFGSSNNLRRNLRQSQSAKTSLLSTTTLGQEPLLSLELSRLKSGVKHRERDNVIIPETLKGVGHDGITRFLTAKVKLLTEQLGVLQKDEKEHLGKIKELQSYKEKLEEEQNKLTQQTNMTRSVIVKLERHASRIGSQLKNAKAENSYLKKEVDSLRKELRESNKKSNANDIRLNRTLEEVDKIKLALQQKTHEDKEFRELHRKKTDELSNVIKKLERQRGELINGFKKQLLIIENLKTQHGLIEANKILREVEEDFFNFLDCNQPDTVS